MLTFPNFYHSDPSLNEVELTAFLSEANLSQMPQPSADSLDSPITLTELKEALLNMKTGKSPGLDGIPPEVFLTFWAQLGPLLLDMIHFSLKNGSFSRDASTAIISLSLKKTRIPLLFLITVHYHF